LGNTPGNNNSNFDHLSHQKKIRQWFMQPGRYCKEIEKEQSKHPEMCIFHLTKSHSTDDCQVKKDCEKQLAEQQSKTSTSLQPSGRLRHIQDDLFEDAVVDSVSEVEQDSNDTNEAGLNYITCVTKHYLRLVKSSPDLITRHSMLFLIIADSGANFHMFWEKEFFTSITPATGKVILGDGKTTLEIQRIGTIKLKIGENIMEIDNVSYVPELSESIYSLFLHVRTP